MRALVLTTCLIFALGAPATAQEGPQAEAPAAVDDRPVEACQIAGSTPVSFSQAANRSDCVSVEGLWQREMLFDGIEGYYRARAHPYYASAKGEDQIGIYGWREAGAPEAPRPARLTGRTGQCEELYGPDVFFVSGYCHYFGGPYIDLSDAVLLSDTPERLTGEATRNRLGLLIEPPADWPQRTYVEAEARRWLSLVTGDDPSAYAQALELSDRDADLANLEGELHAIFREPDTVFGRLRAQRNPVMSVWVIATSPPEPDVPPPPPEDFFALACFRLGNWRGDRWPVALSDADNDPSRPFACVQISRWTSWDRVYEDYDVPRDAHGLREPATFRD